MNLYLISQTINKEKNSYDSAVVVAENKQKARMTYPHNDMKGWDGKKTHWGVWCDASECFC